MDVYVARQPILTRRKKISGYELLFRDETANYVPGINGDVATSTVLDNSFFTIGMGELLDGKKSFINFTQRLLEQKVPTLLPKKSTVIEILEDVDPTPELLNACREMTGQGYTFALDDFAYTPKLDPLIELAEIIKFDFRLSSIEQIQTYLEQIPRHSNLKMLAEKVETYEEFNAAKQMGFDFFQGFFFCKPELISGRKIPGSQLALLQIMAEVNQPNFEIQKIENLIRPDVNLSYRLLRYINSAFFAKAQPIASIQQGLVYLGEAEIRRFVSLVAMSSLGKSKPGELIRAACIRGKFCELLATIIPGKVSGQELFTLGMFSLIDAILDQPMGRIMTELPLSEEIKKTLVARQGKLMGYLLIAETYEKGLWHHMSKTAQVMKIPENKLPDLYGQACAWSNTFVDDQ